MAEGLMEVSRLGINTVAGNLTAEPATIYIHQPRATLTQLQTILYDQYEVRQGGAAAAAARLEGGGVPGCVVAVVVVPSRWCCCCCRPSCMINMR
jgi:hypothetical protein